MSRWLALLIAVIGGGVAAFAAAIGFVAVSYGVLWIYVFGDDPWPKWVDPVLGVLLFAVALGVWVAVGLLIWRQLVRRPG